jgi:hypothetical protein
MYEKLLRMCSENVYFIAVHFSTFVDIILIQMFLCFFL